MHYDWVGRRNAPAEGTQDFTNFWCWVRHEDTFQSWHSVLMIIPSHQCFSLETGNHFTYHSPGLSKTEKFMHRLLCYIINEGRGSCSMTRRGQENAPAIGHDNVITFWLTSHLLCPAVNHISKTKKKSTQNSCCFTLWLFQRLFMGKYFLSALWFYS